MDVQGKIKRSLSNRQGDVFVRREFAQFGSAAQVTRALTNLVETGSLVRLGNGIYAKAKRSVLSGKPIPVRPVEVLAPVALRKLGVVVTPSRATVAYNSGKTTQVPAGVTLNTGKRRISRTLGFNGRNVTYERA